MRPVRRPLAVVAAALVSAAATAGLLFLAAGTAVEEAVPVSWSPDVPAPVVVQVDGSAVPASPRPCEGGGLVVVPVGG